MLNRRDFLKTASLSALAPSLCYLSCKTDPVIPIIDTHVHLLDFDQFPIGWASRRFDSNMLIDDYMKAVEGQHVVKLIYMEVNVPPELRRKEAEWALELCKDPDNQMVGAVIRLDITSPEFESEIRQFEGNPYLKGIRYPLNNAENTPSPQLIENIRLLGELGLSYDLLVGPSSFPIVNQLLEECQSTKFILNHCGNANPADFFPEGKKAPREREESGEREDRRNEWINGIEMIAQRDNLICKISGIVDNVGDYPLVPADLAPIIDHCYNSFGPDRVIFAGDWPVCLRNMSLARWIESVKEVVAGWPLKDQRKLFHDNAASFYGV